MVPGEGPHGGGMIVGEAPGRTEVKLNRPFVGAAGNYLWNALGQLGVLREEVYVTNVVKEMPLDSSGRIRRPYQDEIDAWASYLSTELVEVAPVAVLCLGRTAVDHLMMGHLEFGKNDGYYYAAWHPSFFLHGANGDPDAPNVWLETHLRPWAEALGKYEYPS